MGFTDVAQSHHFTILLFVIGNGNGTFFALRDVSAVIANHPLGVTFFIHDNSDFFSLIEIFCNRFISQFGKVVIQFFGHIHEENIFIEMCEMFVIHRTSSIVFLIFSARGNHNLFAFSIEFLSQKRTV
jgi:hypothetical protein